MATTRINSDGTMASFWRIGKAGPTILQGPNDPDNSVGLNGDLYVQVGSIPRLFIKASLGWTVSSDPVFGYARQDVTTAGTTALDAPTSYVAVNVAGNTTIELMAGNTSKTVQVKDEGGMAGSYPITVIGQNGVTIDGQAGWLIDVNYGALTLTYGMSQWHIVSAITSAPFNQANL